MSSLDSAAAVNHDAAGEPPSLPTTPLAPRPGIDPVEFRRSVRDHIVYTCGKDLRGVDAADLYRAFAHTVRDRLVHRWLATQATYLERDVKRAYYLSAEFLTGRSLGLCLLNMDAYGLAERLADEYGLNLGAVLDAEGDPGLGNGGLGRLAACFMDSLATLQLPAAGYGIRYEYGIFEQRIENGQQVEWQDNWLQHGNPWELPRHEESQTVRFYGRTEMRRGPDGRLRVT
jgi:starch phosphorylase